jgi:hypothetical protein
MDNLSEEESVSPNRRDKGGASYKHFVSPADAVALLSHQLDNALSNLHDVGLKSISLYLCGLLTQLTE